MTIDKRTKVQREPRRQMKSRPASMTIDDGMTNCECFVLDVSPGGARIMTEAAIDISDKFALMLVASHQKRQSCEVVWRRGNEFGVKFVS